MWHIATPVAGTTHPINGGKIRLSGIAMRHDPKPARVGPIPQHDCRRLVTVAVPIWLGSTPRKRLAVVGRGDGDQRGAAAFVAEAAQVGTAKLGDDDIHVEPAQ